MDEPQLLKALKLAREMGDHRLGDSIRAMIVQRRREQKLRT